MPNANAVSDRPRELGPEQAVLGAILLDANVIVTVMEIIRADDFFSLANQIIFESMLEIYDSEDPIDLITVSKHLQRRKQLDNIGGIAYLSSLAGAVPTTANVEVYAREVLRESLERKTRSTMSRLSANEGLSTEEMATAMQEALEEVAERSASNKGGFKHFKQVAMEVFDEIEHRYANPTAGGITGIRSGFNDLDDMTSGFQNQDLIIVGARPSVGKTAFALNVAQNAGKTCGEPIAIFSLEMGDKQLGSRMVSSEGNVDSGRIRSGILYQDDWENLTMAIGVLTEANIYIDDSPFITVNEIRSRCRKLKKEKGLGMILIDYLQLIAGSGRAENRQQEISKITRTLKQMARELDVPVIVLSQLSRGVEQRQDKRPMMSDLRESGAIEQDADIVAFLYRDDYYDKESEKKNIIEIIIAKQRNGPIGTVELAFLKNFNKFVGLDRSHAEPSVNSQNDERPKQNKRNVPDMNNWRNKQR